MIKFSPKIRKDLQRTDGSHRVYICMAYGGARRYIATEMLVQAKEVTAKGRIKNEMVLRRCDAIINEFKKRIYELDIEIDRPSVQTVVDHITRQRTEGELSFTAWTVQWIKEAKIKDVRNYHTAIRAFHLFMQMQDIPFSMVTTTNLNAFVEYLSGKQRARSSYPACIVKVFKDACNHYNDEESDIVEIKNTIRKFKTPKQNLSTEKRALDVETIRQIFELPYDNKTARFGLVSRHDMALDCFRLSFCLMGMNSVDLYGATKRKGRYILYNRQKTRDRRADHAEMKVFIPDVAVPIVEKYAGSERVFNFHRRYSNYRDFNKHLNIGLKEIAKELGIDSLTFYAARHSMATIAVNDVGIDKYTVSEMLCHTDNAMKVTDIYIRKDFSRINKAMAKVLDHVLGKIH